MKTIKELEAEKKRIPKPQSHQYTNNEWYSVVNEKIRQLKDVLKLIDEIKKKFDSRIITKFLNELKAKIEG